MKKKFPKSFRKRSLCSMGQALDALVASHGGERRLHLNALWENWDHVMGEDIVRLGRPLGHHKTTLMIGAEDNMAMQELAMQTWEILERANTFMDEEFFTDVKSSLMQGRHALADKEHVRGGVDFIPVKIDPPEKLWGLLPGLDATLHYARYYTAYVKAMQGEAPHKR